MAIRREALYEKATNLDAILKKFHFEQLYDQSLEFVSFGPFFGGDASGSCMKLPEKSGLTYIDDFFIFEAYFTEWCRVEVFGINL